VSLRKLRARWIGHAPRVGDYLMSAMRPRYAYRVEQVTNSSSEVHWDPVAKTEARQLQIGVVRVPRDGVPKHARVHVWKWDKRIARARSVPQ
jgi:hypothetical protein